MLAALAVATAAAVAVSATASANTSKTSASSASSSCQLGNGIKHVIDIVFDNVHVNRDNPNVLSDIEQIPSLYNFITQNGTLLTNNHTPLIGHTANDLTTNFTGLYGDRQGMGVSNDYFAFTPSGGVTPSGATSAGQSVFSYWTGGGVGDGFPQMDYSSTVPPTGGTTAPPAPWVPYTRAGCNVGGISAVNLEMENTSPDIANVFGASSPEEAQLNADPDSFKDQEVNDYIGLAVHCAKSSSFCASNSRPVADVLPDEPGGYTGYDAVFGHKYLQPELAGAANSGDNRTFANGDSFPVVDSAGNLTDLNGAEMDGQYVHTPGFPGFGPITAAQTLAYTADMQESGVPVTYAYISDVHAVASVDTGPCSPASTYRGHPDVGYADGPGDNCYYQTTASYNAAFATFLKRLSDDGITPANTLFVFGADEGDHFSGANLNRAETPSCTGTPLTTSYICTYQSGQVGEVSASIHGLLKYEENDTTPFASQPQGESVYVTGNQPAPVVRQLERDFANVTVNDPFDGTTETAVKWMADPVVEELLHFSNADPNRIPTFTAFPKPDVYFTSGQADSPACRTGTTAANAPTNCTSINSQYAWNHGYYAPEINNTWAALVGPGVKHLGVDGSGPGQGPSSAGDANSGTTTDTQIVNNGTWLDQADIQPTIMALTGLQDDYTPDGRVLVEDMTNPPDKAGQPKFLALAKCYKQLNSSVGEFGTDVLVADTAALESGSSTDDSTYANELAQITSLGSDRDALATQIKSALYDAEFNNKPIPGDGDLAHCQGILQQADELAGVPTEIKGDVQCKDQTLTNVTVDGNLTVAEGSRCRLTGGTVKGNVQANNAASVDIQGGSIGGNLQIQGTTSSSTVNDVTIGGNLQVQNNAGSVAAGGNTVHGNIEVHNNTGGGTLTGNSAGGNCQL
ncbi:MAG: polymer-forming cytoskeletal protein, partial [Acidimicrobiia bacterium]|nr:polymer-forming cytoskeletal protein [Acidimicrobiia bacterium]